MSESKSTSYMTTTTTTKVGEYIDPPRSIIIGPTLDFGYLKTLPGMVKCIAISLDFICFLCVLAGGSGYYTGAGWSTFVCIVGLIVTISLMCLYLFRIVDIVQQFPWIIGEMIFCFAWSIFFFIAGCVLAVAAVRIKGAGGWGVAAFFAFGAMCTYGFDCYIKFLAWKNNEIASGGDGGAIIVVDDGKSSNDSATGQRISIKTKKETERVTSIDEA